MPQEAFRLPRHGPHSSSPAIRWAGTLLIAATALLLADVADLTLPVLDTLVIPLSGWVPLLVGRLLLLAAFLVLARGLLGQPGAAGDSRLGQLCLVVWGSGALLFMLVGVSPFTVDDFPALPSLIAVLQSLVSLAAILAAVAVVRAGVLQGWTAWALLPAAAIEAALTVARLVPAIFDATYPALETVHLLQLVLLLLAGATFLITDRQEVLLQRVHAIKDAW